jgi:hypothetical protein
MKQFLFILFVVIACSASQLLAQDFGRFNEKKFPADILDSTIIARRGLEATITMLTDSCVWYNRIGDKVNVFWAETEKGHYFGHVYEYLLECDNVRLIYWYDNRYERGKIVDFMIEPLEQPSRFVEEEDQLKERDQYKSYFEAYRMTEKE